MSTKKKASLSPIPFVPTVDHQLTVGEAQQVISTITVYGKLITGVTLTPSEAGTIHPRGGTGDLQLCLVYGIQDRGKCITLPQPQKVYLPAPDGAADGCGWDPEEFVVWKNLPRDWNTLHVQSRLKPLSVPLQPMTAAVMPSALDVMTGCWLNTSDGISRSAKLSDLWNEYVGKETYQALGANQLAQCLNQASPEWSWVNTGIAQKWTTVDDALNAL
jgi:hypothetical protein